MDTIGSAGTLVAAGLATAGQYLQSRVLDLFQIPFGTSLAVLIFSIAALSLFYRVAIFSDYRSGLLFLLGCTLFGLAVFPRVNSYGVRWQLGNNTHKDALVADTLNGVYDFVGDRGAEYDQRRSFEVSWLFAKFDQLTSGIVQTAIKLVGVTTDKDDLKFLARTTNFQRLLNLGIVDSQVQLYLHSVLFNRCADWLSLHQSLIDPAQFERQTQVQNQIDRWNGKVVLTKKDISYELTEKLYSSGFFGNNSQPLPEQLSCQDLWILGMGALRPQAYSQSLQIISDSLPDNLTPDEMLTQAAIKFGDNNDPDPQDIGRMVNAIAARMLVGAFREQYPALSRVNVLPPIRIANDDDILFEEDRYGFSKNLQEKTLSDIDFSQGEYFGYVASLPYVQGILLFFLALSYPVFALMLLNPMRIRAYLVWFGLWFWVKLWDFGFSVVMKIDGLLYYLLPHGPNLDDTNMADPGAVIRAVVNADPTSSILVYWDIMAMLLSAVPIVTAMITWVGGSIVMYQVQSILYGYSQGKIATQFQQSIGSGRAATAITREQVSMGGPSVLPRNQSVSLPAPNNIDSIMGGKGSGYLESEADLGDSSLQQLGGNKPSSVQPPTNDRSDGKTSLPRFTNSSLGVE